MFRVNIKRSVVTVGVVAGLLAAAGPASAQGGGADFTRFASPGPHIANSEVFELHTFGTFDPVEHLGGNDTQLAAAGAHGLKVDSSKVAVKGITLAHGGWRTPVDDMDLSIRGANPSAVVPIIADGELSLVTGGIVTDNKDPDKVWADPAANASSATGPVVAADFNYNERVTGLTARLGSTEGSFIDGHSAAVESRYVPGQGSASDPTAQGFIMSDGRICDPIRHMGC